MVSMGNTHDKNRLVPTQPSNKNVLDQALLWGWAIRVSTGDWVELEHSERAERIKVRTATHRSGNGHDVLARLYKITCNGNGNQFWSRVEPYHARPGKPPAVGMTDEQMEEYAARMRQQRPQETLIDKLDRAAGLRIVPDVQETVPTTPPPRMVEQAVSPAERNTSRMQNSKAYVPGSEPRPRTIEYEVLQALRALSSMAPVVTCEALIIMLDDLTKLQIVNTCTRLADRGLLEHAGRGKYRLIKIAEQQASPIAAPQPAVQPVPETPTVSAPAPATSTHDATVDAVLDLMFPDGAQMKHMAALIKWREDTIQLMTEILNG